MTPLILLAVDPGTKRCGLAVLGANGEIIEKRVAQVSDFADEASEIIGRCKVTDVVVGSGTGSAAVIETLQSLDTTEREIHVIEEKNTTLLARQLCEKENPRPWPLRMIPFGLFSMPDDMDAWAAAVIGRRYLESKRG